MPFCKSFVTADKELHDLKSFDCGKDEMNDFLSRYAVKNMTLGISSTWILTAEIDGEPTPEVVAYYTLAITTLTRDEIPTDTKLPGYPVPIVLLARLAIANASQGKGLGEKTLVQSLRHAVQLCEQGLPAFGLVLDVLDDEALAFYQKYDLFNELTNDPMRLFVGMETIKQI